MTETAPPIDLRPDHWAIVCDILRRHIPDRKVLVFGSRATWTAKDYSDLDLAILGDAPLPLDTISALAETFGESDLPFKVDLVDWARVDEAFREVIRRAGVDMKVLHAASVPVKQLEKSANVDWRTATVEEISEKVAMGPFGSSIKVETFTSEGIPIVNGQHLHGTRLDDSPGYRFISEDHATRLSNANVQRGDIVFTHRGTIGQVAYIPENSEFERYIISQSQFIVRCNKSNAIPEFVTAYFKSPEGQHKLLANASQVGVPSIAQPVTYLRKVEIPLPPLPEQRAIAHILGTLDDKIELNRRMNETLEAMAGAIFKDWFVDFGPTRAKGEGRAPYLAPELWNLFPDALNDEGKPVGWERKPLDEIADFLNGLALQKYPASGSEDSLPVIKIAELRGGITAKSNRASRSVPEKYVVTDGDFLFSWSGSLLAKFWTEGEGALNQHLFKVTSNRYPAWFFALWVHHHLEGFRVIAASKATTMGHIQRAHLKGAITTCPPDDALSILGQTVGPFVERAIKNELESRTLAQTRDLLLPKLMAGEINLREAERQVEAVV